MSTHSSVAAVSLKSLATIFAMGLLASIFVVSASAQIRIGNVEIRVPKNPQPKNPPPTTNPNPTRPNPNGNRTPTTPNANTRPTSNTKVETGATRDQVSEFNKDMAPYREGMYSLKWWSESTNSVTSGCGDVKTIRRNLTEGAAFLEIIKQKYPGIENPSWSAGNSEHHLVGDFRRAAENRVAIVKKCVNGLVVARLKTKIESIESAIAEFDKGEWGGYVLAHNFNDKAPDMRKS